MGFRDSELLAGCRATCFRFVHVSGAGASGSLGARGVTRFAPVGTRAARLWTPSVLVAVAVVAWSTGPSAASEPAADSTSTRAANASDHDDAVSERHAWDVFIWYGGVVRLGAALNDYGITRVFADSVGESLSGLGWPGLFAIALLVYFYAHYGFASITMHFLAMFPPFVALLTSRGAPAGLTVYAFACLASPAAGLTHYGTVPAPMFFSQNYVGFRDWWKVGFLLSLWNLAVWVSTGLLWWKLIGLW